MDKNDFPDNKNLDLSFDDLDSPQKAKAKPAPEENYILGTLIVRVVAARELPAVNSGLGKLLFGKHKRAGEAGSANPYASVRFGSTVQRTSQVFASTDPTWPRHETIYMDVVHPTFPEGTRDTKKKSQYVVEKKITKNDDRAPPKPILTVACFHSDGGKKYNPTKDSGDSDDVFLGMASADLTTLITGKIRTFDQWLPLTGCNEGDRAAVRVTCEYEVSDPPPRKGDLVRFTRFCSPEDLYPAIMDRLYIVEERENDDVWISWTSAEGWISSYRCHRYMLFCEERHQGAAGFYQEEFASITDRLSHSPMVHTVRDSLQRIPDDGIVAIGQDIFKGGLSLLNRWREGGLDRAVGDIVFATNWDGHMNPTLDTDDVLEPIQERSEDTDDRKPPADDSIYEDANPDVEPLPNMPPCPITGEPMKDPVVAADGHTYERNAIARWLRTSDRSPLTGSILEHKNLVPNYMLLSSIQDSSNSLTGLAAASLPHPSSTGDLADEDIQ